VDEKGELAADQSTGSGYLVAESLRQSQEQFEKLVANVRDYAIFLLDPKGRVISWNAGARQLKGYEPDEILGKHFSVFYPRADIERGWPDRELALASSEGHFEDEGWRIRKDGTRFWANVVITALHDENGRTRGYMKITRDLTERRLTEEQLRHTQDELEERVKARTAELERTNERLRESQHRLELNDRRKDQFLAVLSHELRNPLAPVRTAVEVLRRAHMRDAHLLKALDILGRQVMHMTRLVDDLLDVSRITSGKVHLERACIDLSQLLRTVVGDLRSAMEAASLSLALEVPDSPIYVNADEIRLSQAFGNVLSNAIKFTEPGGSIGVGLQREGEEAVVAIADTGMGIRPDMLEQVFEPFTQDEGTGPRERGGLGLGLALVRGLVEMHGGSVTAASRGAGDGATFTIRLPAVEPGASVAASRRTPDSTRRCRRVLVIEDNADAADMIEMLLSSIGHEVEVAYTGADGLAKAAATRPEVVICDIGLTDMSGLDVAPRLRALLPEVFLIASTGYGQDEDRRRTREAGFDLHLTKPMDPGFLERVIEDSPRAKS
jgi:PAS domain S-box-containing protein